MSPLAVLRSVVLLGAILALAACQDDSARAEEHYRNALAFLEDGDTVRADIEFRNVFQADGEHLEARERYARMLRETGDLEHAYAQYLRLVEQDPGRDLPGSRWRRWRSISRTGKRRAGTGSGCWIWPPIRPARM
jgi:thioredoxin-like negative regulator of GroEL